MYNVNSSFQFQVIIMIYHNVLKLFRVNPESISFFPSDSIRYICSIRELQIFFVLSACDPFLTIGHYLSMHLEFWPCKERRRMFTLKLKKTESTSMKR